jgi:glycosyltransferase involved in cell wall biosynthesis
MDHLATMTTPIEKSLVVSLVVPTVGRVSDLDRLLASLAGQTCKQFELIIVDQNSDDRIKTLLLKWKRSLHYIYARSALGASRARNVGLALARGDVIGFPDDDCWFPPDLIAQVKAWFEPSPHYDFLCCSARDEAHKDVALRWPRYSQPIHRSFVLTACICFAFFIRRTALIQVGGFDEAMGPGAETPFQCGEETDLALRLLDNSHAGWFEKRLYVHHPQKDARTAATSRGFYYGMGLGYLLRKHRFPVGMWVYQIVRASGGALRAFCLAHPREALFYLKSAAGRTLGFLQAPLKEAIQD